MTSKDPWIISRYESKYLIPESTARAVRDAIRGLCVPDRNADASGVYVVNNFYFDTPDLRFYHDTKFKQYNRFKLRVRYYGDVPEGNLWLEIKHKIRNITWKTRRPCPLAQWESIFEAGQGGGGLNGQPLSLRDSFENAVLRFGAEPRVHVRYLREPYLCDFESYCRITFDRNLSFRPTHGSLDLVSSEPFMYYDDAVTSLAEDDDSPVILEIKTETQVPPWIMGLIRRFQLQQRGFSKYCYAVDNTMEQEAQGMRFTPLSAIYSL